MAQVGGCLAAGVLLIGCGDSSGVSAQNHKDFVAGCSSSQPAAACECVFKQLTTKQGVNSDSKLKSLNDKLQVAARSSNPAGAVPPELRNAVLACKNLVRR